MNECEEEIIQPDPEEENLFDKFDDDHEHLTQITDDAEEIDLDSPKELSF